MKRIDLLINDTMYKDYIQRNMDEEINAYCQHDFRHHLDVARITYILVLENNDLNYFIKESGLSGKLAAKEVIYAAGLLHDIGKWKEFQTGTDHASYGSRLAREVLPRALFNEQEIEIICQGIFEHRNISMDMSFLGERLHRADNLSHLCLECPAQNVCPKMKNRDASLSSLEY
ncbi:HD domain-containing protein [Syntrophomonas palmitatica]|uniref:HD domain-containing protein n=1 Tax=Syntrophomonas palmitatica TaxID=402877 RepID=UPI0006D1BA7B|nr:HD domain-containing protein [Syntrophomonas palmitatica]